MPEQNPSSGNSLRSKHHRRPIMEALETRSLLAGLALDCDGLFDLSPMDNTIPSETSQDSAEFKISDESEVANGKADEPFPQDFSNEADPEEELWGGLVGEGEGPVEVPVMLGPFPLAPDQIVNDLPDGEGEFFNQPSSSNEPAPTGPILGPELPPQVSAGQPLPVQPTQVDSRSAANRSLPSSLPLANDGDTVEFRFDVSVRESSELQPLAAPTLLRGSDEFFHADSQHYNFRQAVSTNTHLSDHSHLNSLDDGDHSLVGLASEQNTDDSSNPLHPSSHPDDSASSYSDHAARDSVEVQTDSLLARQLRRFGGGMIALDMSDSPLLEESDVQQSKQQTEDVANWVARIGFVRRGDVETTTSHASSMLESNAAETTISMDAREAAGWRWDANSLLAAMIAALGSIFVGMRKQRHYDAALEQNNSQLQ